MKLVYLRFILRLESTWLTQKWQVIVARALNLEKQQMLKKDAARTVLVTNIDVLSLRLNQDIIQRWCVQLPQWPGFKQLENIDSAELCQNWIDFLHHHATQLLNNIDRLQSLRQEFQNRIHNAATAGESRAHILWFAKALGATPRQLKKDEQALSRWFGADAVLERAERQRNESEFELCFCLQRLGSLWLQRLTALDDANTAEQCWRQSGFEKIITPLLSYEGDKRVRIAAFKALAEGVSGLPQNLQEVSMAPNINQYIYRLALEKTATVWLQTAALELLASLAPAAFAKVLELRLLQHGEGDDLFVRHHAVLLLAHHHLLINPLPPLLANIHADPSPFVRQALATILPSIPIATAKENYARLVLQDDSPQVRAAALTMTPLLVINPELFTAILANVATVLAQEQNSFALRTCMRFMVDAHQTLLTNKQPSLCLQWQQTLTPALTRLYNQATDIAVRHWSAQYHERLWAQETTDRYALLRALQTFTQHIKPGKRKSLRKFLKHTPSDTIYRLLAVIAQRDYSFEIEEDWLGTFLTRGSVFGVKPWRILHELRHPGTEKRQAHAHTIGRIYFGNIHIPSVIMSELSETKVPGEPLFLTKEKGWRPYLPLVDEMLSILRLVAKPMQIFTSEGITTVKPPRWLWQRMWAWLLINWHFFQIARLRNGSQQEITDYVAFFRNLHFAIQWRSYGLEETPPSQRTPYFQTASTEIA